MNEAPFAVVLVVWGGEQKSLCPVRLLCLEVLLPFLPLNVCSRHPGPVPLSPLLVLVYALEWRLQLLGVSSSPRSLLILFVEIDYWERLLFETPHYVVNVAERSEDLRILRENLLLVARDYNRWGPGPDCSPSECRFMPPLCLLCSRMLSISCRTRCPAHFVRLKNKQTNKKNNPVSCALV